MNPETPSLPRVLFVDDQAEVLENLQIHVSEICEPMVAQTAEKGLEIFKEHGPFTIVVSDQASAWYEWGRLPGYGQPTRSLLLNNAAYGAWSLFGCHAGRK